MSALRYTWQNALRGVLIYTAGDTAAALISGEFCWTRMVGVAAVGGTLYALEIPSYFAWIDRRVPEGGSLRSKLARAGLALLFFNPLWIARHLLLIKLFSLDWQTIEALEALLVETSICGLGYVVLNPLISAAKHWPEEIPGSPRDGGSTDGEGIA